MGKQKLVHPYNKILFGNKEKFSTHLCTKNTYVFCTNLCTRYKSMYLENIMLSERNWSQKTTYYMTSLTQNVQNRQNYRDNL